MSQLNNQAVKYHCVRVLALCTQDRKLYTFRPLTPVTYVALKKKSVFVLIPVNIGVTCHADIDVTKVKRHWRDFCDACWAITEDLHTSRKNRVHFILVLFRGRKSAEFGIFQNHFNFGTLARNVL